MELPDYFVDCGTKAIMALIRIVDDPVREKAISSISKSLESGKHPLTGKILKDKKLTEREIKQVIEKSEMEVRGELTKKYTEDRKNKTSPVREEPPDAHPDPEPPTKTDPVLPATISPPAPSPIDPVKAKTAEMNRLADALLELMPSAIQVMVTDIIREHPSYKVKDVFYFGVQALSEQKHKK